VNDAGREESAGRRRGLGMGLSALLGSDLERRPRENETPQPLKLPIELLHPSRLQPRRHFDQSELEALAESIRSRGVMQPLLVRPVADSRPTSYEIVAGERRWRAAQMAGLHDLPVVVHDLSDRDVLEVALIENVQRQDLSPLEEAEGYRRLIDEFGHTQDALASSLGKSRSHIANLIRLLGLPEGVRRLLEDGQLSAGHARALLGVRDPEGLARAVVARGLNVRQTEALARADSQAATRARPAAGADPNTAALERDLSQRLGLNVRVTARGEGGVVAITYSSLDQLDSLLRRLA
jgi:ParB family transcriptional regulator, chromosome partitioning protein